MDMASNSSSTATAAPAEPEFEDCLAYAFAQSVVLSLLL